MLKRYVGILDKDMAPLWSRPSANLQAQLASKPRDTVLTPAQPATSASI